jgi:hypothetical protein
VFPRFFPAPETRILNPTEQNKKMMNRIRQNRREARLGYRVYRFENDKREIMSGAGDGDFIRLRDAQGTEWQGSADPQGDYIRLSFRNGRGQYATGIANSMGVMLKDNQGNIWRGFLQ